LASLQQRRAEGGLAGGEAEQVGGDPHLAVAGRAGADADHGNGQLGGDGGGQVGRHVLQHQGEAARLLQGQGVALQPQSAGGVVALAAIAELVHRLGRQAHVPHHRNAGAHQPVDHREGFRFGPLQFHGGGRTLLERPTGGGHGVIGTALIAEERQVHDQQRLLAQGADAGHPPGGGPAVMEHLLQGHRQGGGMAEHHHGQRVAHQHGIRAGLGHQGPGEGIPGGEHRDRQPGLLAAGQIGGAQGHG